MQNVDNLKVNDTNEVGQDHSSSSSPISTERGQSLTSIPTNFMADMSDSDEDDVSEVESFILDQGDLDEEPVLDTTKFLLQGEGADSPDLHNVDPETQARLEALLEATDPEVLRRLTSSVSCALDEAAAALTRMRAEHGSAGTQGESGNNGRSLVEACSDGDVGTVRRLLDEGRNVNEITEEGESLLSLACSSGYYELAQLLLAMRANVEDRGLKDTTPLMEAASTGHGDVVKLLVAHGADVNAQTSQGNTPLMFACASGHEEVVQVLLQAGANVEDHNENGHTPLMEAASGGHVGVAKLLVEHGASINTHSNEFKESALTLACYKGHLEMVRFLLDAGADQEHKTDEMHTALMEASMDGHVEVARLLLDSGAQVNMPADSFESPLTLAACGGHVELALLLLERGANIEEVNDEGYTPLMEAAREGHEEMVALLLSQAGADINAQTEETQETALTLACCGGFLDVADFLIKAGADIELGASTPLMEAAQEGHLELVRYLISASANVNAQTATGDTALTYACENGHTDVADILLQAAAELEHESEGGRTPLMKAARAGHLCTVQFLISKGANVNKQTSNNDHNPLSLACAGGHLAVVELLLAHGADPTHKLKDNSTMLIEAAKGGHTAVVQLLLDYPNNLLASPPPPPDLSQLTTTALEAAEAPRVPPHGLQVFSPPEAELSVSAGSPYLANVQPVTRLPQPVPIPDMSHSQQTAIKQNIQKSLQRKTSFVKSSEAPSSSSNEVQGQQRSHHRSKSNASAQANSTSIQAETGGLCEAEIGGGGSESLEMKPSERLEACINSMMKKAELLNPSREEQILQKQQILEELQRVERELQEKAQAQLLLTAQHQQQHHHHHHLQGLATVATVTPTIATMTNNTATLPPMSAAHSQQLLLNSATILDMGSLPSAVVPELSGITGHLGLSLRATAAAHLSTPVGVSPLQPQQLYQMPKALPQQANIPDQSKGRINKQPTKLTKNTISKQQPLHVQMPQMGVNSKIQPPTHLEEVEKMNLRNVVLSEQQQQQFLQHPQQYVLSEITQNLTLRANSHLPEGTADALTLMQAAGGIKFTTDSTQAHAIPIIDPVAVSQAFALQQQQQQQLHLQQLPQPIQTEMKRQHAEKLSKSLKSKISKSQQSQQIALQHGQCQTQLLQGQPQVLAKPQLNPVGAMDSCTIVGNLPLDAAGVFTLGGMATPTFPVSLAVSPATLTTPVTIATSCATFTHSISLEDGLMVAAPARTLHDTLGEIMTGPTTQLAGTQMAMAQQVATSHCVDPCLAAATSGVGVGVGLTMTSPSTALTPLTFHTLTPTVTSCVPAAVTSAVLPPHPHPQLNHVATTAQSTPAPQLYPPIDLNSQTDSNHDTALTLACAGGHEELVSLLLSRGADIEHRDKKGFTPLMLAATAGHAGVVEILLNHGADIEAQSERTKDTALSLACSGGRYEVVEILLARGANKEHRNVSDYTPLSLAASGGYVNIIKLLLSHGAEINSRTGSKLGISPLMLAAMNGHTAAVKLLLDMGSDINAQIETNRNTALTLACFQGRHEVVSLLLDRKANVEHRAKTGLTPLMEAASGGYVEVGRVLLDKGADVNAPPVPSSRDTALTIAADKGHYRFVELLLARSAAVDVKNKKGNSPLWLAANGGHLDVVQLLVNERADIDSQDNRKVSCLMAAFRKGHVKVVKWMVKHVQQFPSDQEMTRYIATISDKELLKKCHQCMEIIRAAKERQAAEANKYATILLEELDLERSREETRRAAAARRRERKRRKKKEKQEQLRAAKAAAEETKRNEIKIQDQKKSAQQSSQSEADDDDDDEEEEEEEDDDKDLEYTISGATPNTYMANDTGSCRVLESPDHNEALKCKIPSNDSLLIEVNPVKNRNMYLKSDASRDDAHIKSRINLEIKSERKRERERAKNQERSKRNETLKNLKCRLMKEKELKLQEKSAHTLVETDSTVTSISNSIINRNSKKRSQKQDPLMIVSSTSSTFTTTTMSITNSKPCSTEVTTTVIATIVSSDAKCQTTNCNILREQHKHGKEVIVNGVINNNGMGDLDSFSALGSSRCSKGGKLLVPDAKISTLGTFGELALELNPEMIISAGLRSPTAIGLQHALKSPFASSTSPKKAQKREEGWKEVVRRSKKVSVPSNAISRVIGRGGCNINAIREVSGAHIEVEKQKGQGDRTIIIRGSAEATRQAHQLITALIKEPERELSEILTRAGLCRVPGVLGSGSNEGLRAAAGNGCSSTTVTSTVQVTCGNPTTTINQSKVPSRQTSITKISGIVSINPSKVSTIPPSLPANAAPPFALQSRAAVSSNNVRPSISVGTPFPSNSQNVWTGVVLTGKAPLSVAPRPSSLATNSVIALLSTGNVSTSGIGEKTLINRQLFPSEKKLNNIQCGTSTTTKTTVSYTMAVIAQSRSTKSVPADTVTVTTKLTLASDMKISTTNATMQSEWSGNNSSPVATNTVVSSGHGTISTPLPFPNNSASVANRVINGVVNSQIIQGGNGNVQPSNMNHKQPFVTTSTSLQNPPLSSPNSVNIDNLQSTIAQEYSPFNNLFSKVAQPSVWGQKDKEPTKPNFASVAAAGVTSVSSHVQNSHPIQSSLSLSLSSNTERIVDAAKAPGYRGNLHISPNSSCNPTVTTVAHSISHSAGFGAIGTGPRSAPCTPPLGPIGPPPSLGSSIRRSTPPSVPSPPPLHSRSLPDSHGFPIADVQRSVPSAGQVSSALSTVPHTLSASQMPENIFQHHPHHHHHAMQNMSGLSATVRLPSFPLAAGNGGSGFSGPAGSHTNTTFSQHSPLSSVGSIVQDTGSNNGSVSTNNSNLQVIQSTLNPNAPDFSSRASVLMAHHGPSLHTMPHRLPSGPNAFQDGPVTPLAPFRPIIPSTGNMNHTFPSIHGLPGHPPGIGRFPFHPNHNQQQQQPTDLGNQANAGPVGSLHPGLGGPGLQQATDGMPLLGMMAGYPPHNAQGLSHVGPGNGNLPHHYSAMPSVIGIRPNQRSSSATPSVGTPSKGDEGSPMSTISPTASPQSSNLSSPTGIGLTGEDGRKLPRPIGMERAQRKQPMYGGVSDISGIWSYSVPEMACTGEWMTNLSSGMIPNSSLSQEDLIPPLLPNNYGNNRFGDNILVSESNHQIDQPFQLASAAAGSGYPPFVNGIPPHMMTPHLYQSSNSGGPSSLRPSGIESNVEMWGGPNKLPLSSVSDGLSSAPEHKMAWHNWSQHQA